MYRALLARDRILSYWPEDNPDTHPEDYARVRLMLHHPFKRETYLLTIDEQVILTFRAAFAYCRANHSDHEDDHYGNGDVSDEPEDLYDEPTQDNGPIGSWGAFAAPLPDREDHTDVVDDTEALGWHDVDVTNDWAAHLGRCAPEPDFWKGFRTEHPADLVITSAAHPDSLNEQ
ncbi:uncharacterized protein N7515_006153 [Penicillium bovifimosum]|uniref:Uncharacterized protein n=1 Tax=Penicillium bovifimosum TaxID=126998 RepID=A0A9W9L0I0_9EURO|nr:uncharacterized protein N7515_006153 [Penicillium bovifimosum]KAJ5130114.1 hypothetical protein N7515_006153 [Penicillium bovifimosum]